MNQRPNIRRQVLLLSLTALLAVANALAPNARLQAGQLVKVAIPEPYSGRSTARPPPSATPGTRQPPAPPPPRQAPAQPPRPANPELEPL